MTPIALRQTGEYDAASEVSVDADGRYTAEHGGYVTAGRREGRLSAAVDLDWRSSAPGSFETTLTVGDRSITWAGAPPTPETAALVGALARLT